MSPVGRLSGIWLQRVSAYKAAFALKHAEYLKYSIMKQLSFMSIRLIGIIKNVGGLLLMMNDIPNSIYKRANIGSTSIRRHKRQI